MLTGEIKFAEILLHFARDAMLTTLGFLPGHPLQNRGLRERCPTTVFLENTSTFVLLLEAPQCAVDRLVVLNCYAYHY